MKPKINQSKAKRVRTTKSGLVKRSRVGQQHRRASKSNRQKRAAKTALVAIDSTDKKLFS